MSIDSGSDDKKIIKFSALRKNKKRGEKILIPANDPPQEPILNLPPTVKNICFINIAAFLLIFFFPKMNIDDLAFIPARYFGQQPFGLGGIISPFTHMFIHAGWLHLSINTGTLMAFGAGIEKNIGGKKLLLLYFSSGLLGALLHALSYHSMTTPMIGASGAISGLFGAVLMMMSEQGQMGRGYKKLLPFIVIWIGISIFFGMFGLPGTENPVAWTTHIGGFLGGLLLYRPIARMKL